MARRLITCPVCKKDCHVYKDKLARHTGDSILTCLGSGEPVSPFTGRVGADKLERIKR